MIRKASLLVCCVFLFFVIHQTIQQPHNQVNDTNDDDPGLNHNFTILNASAEAHRADRVSYRKCREYRGLFDDDYKEVVKIETEIEENTEISTDIPEEIEENSYVLYDDDDKVETSPEGTGVFEENTQTDTEIPEKIKKMLKLKSDNSEEMEQIKSVTETPENIKNNMEMITTGLSKIKEEVALTKSLQGTEKTPTWTVGLGRGHREIPVIAGGETSKLREFPHMAAIGWENSDGSYNFDCGGALISPRFVLTAAHCTYSHGADNPVPKLVVLGDQNIDSSVIDGASPVQVEIKKIYKHPEYTRKKHYNDIALFELNVHEAFIAFMEPACLWTSRDLGEIDSAIATGWGVTDPYTGKRAKELQKVSLPILSNEVCNTLLSNHINRKWEKGFLDTQLCAGEINGGKDTCPGDSGSPLQVNSDEYFGYVVIGITSFGPRFCNQLPAVYTRVSSYLDWIESIVWPDEYQNWLNKTTAS